METIYYETESKDVEPDGEGWSYWSMRITPDEEKAVWYKDVTEEEAVQFYLDKFDDM